MKPLNINQALQLYKILAPYLPNEIDDNLNFVGKIIENIKISGNHRAYVEAIAVMTDLEVEEVLQYDPKTEALEMFAEGLVINKISLLRQICEKAGING